MNQSFLRFFVAGTVLSAVLIPFKAVSNPLGFLEDRCQPSASLNCDKSLMAQTPGGLEVYLESNLKLKPSNVHYKYDYKEAVGFLSIKVQGKQIEIPIEPEVVRDALKVVENNDESWIYSFSGGDRTAIGPKDFIDPKVDDTVLGSIFMDGDYAFALFVWGDQELPPGSPIHPKKEAWHLYKSNSEYRKLVQQWEAPPEVVSMVEIHFDPTQKGSVRLEFPPQVQFKSPDAKDISIEVDKSSESLAKLPYMPLAEDVRKRPMAYRNESHNLDKAAKAVAVMGYLEAACQKPGSCQALLEQTQNVVKKLKAETKKRGQSEDEAIDIKENADSKQNASIFEPGNNSQAWTAAYKAVKHLIKEESFFESESSYYYRDDYKNKELKDLTAKQFLNYEVPQEALLQGAAIVVFSSKGDEALAEKAFNQAIALSSNNPLARLTILKMARQSVWLLEDAEKSTLAKSFDTRIKTLKTQALVAAYKEFDKYLNSCLENQANCSEADLRLWEDDALAELTEDTTWGLENEDIDVAWLHGRFNYLIGKQLNDPSDIRNRLRYLSYYTDNSSGERKIKLRQFEADLEKRLVTALNPVPIISLNAVAKGSTPKWLGGITAVSIAGVVVGTKFKNK